MIRLRWCSNLGGALAIGVLLFGCAGVEDRLGDVTAAPKQMRARQLIVTLADANLQEREAITQALASQYQLRETGSFPLGSIGVQCVVFEVPAQWSMDAVVERLRLDPRVKSVQPNQVFEGAETPHADPYAKLEYGPTVIRADAAHRISTGKGVRVVVVDTGVDVDHPDLRGRVAKTVNFVDGGEISFKTDRHGTAIVGIIGARADNGVGIFGIAPDAEMMAAKACWYADGKPEKALCSSWTLAKAIDFAIGERARVINLSLSGPADPLLGRLLVAAEAQKIAVVAAAAEQGSDPGFPAALEPVIAVIASDATGHVQTPHWLDHKQAIAAPGVDILTTTPHGSYDFISGSSLSAAEVTGVVALLIERKPALAPAEARALLRRTLRPVKSQAGASVPTTVGIVDACAALSAMLAEPVCP